MDFCFSSILTNASFYSSHQHLSSTFLGILMAISTTFFVGLAVPFGRLSDRMKRTYLLSAACLLLASVSFIFPFCQRKLHLVIAFPCVGTSMALFWPAYEAWLAEREGVGSLIERLMIFNLFWSVGITFGPFISGHLYRDSNPFIPFYLAGGFSVLNWCVIVFQDQLHRNSHTHLTDDSQPLLPATTPTQRHVYLQIARIANFASWFALGVLQQLAPKLTLEMGIPTKLFGNLMLTLGLVQILIFLWFGTPRSTRWHYRLTPLVGAQALAGVGFIGIWFLKQPILWAPAFALIGACAAVTYFSSMYYSLHEQADKGNKSGWHEAILGSGVLLGPFLGGAFADSALGVKSPYLLCAGIIGLCMCVECSIWAITKKRR
ncbi:MAG: MFS transporter [Candidatus Poribacteria bacterium]|nr:MFS transporter [Candidatus Poribacteria bacterium]